MINDANLTRQKYSQKTKIQHSNKHFSINQNKVVLSEQIKQQQQFLDIDIVATPAPAIHLQ